MAGWFSSQLRAAEQLLAKIDQTAAVTLKKDERQRSGLLGSDSEYSDAEQSDRTPVRRQDKNQIFLNDTESDPAPALPAVATPPTSIKQNSRRTVNQSQSPRGRYVAPSQLPKSGRLSGKLSGSISGASTPYDSDASEADDWTELLGASDPAAVTGGSGTGLGSGRLSANSHAEAAGNAGQSKSSRGPRHFIGGSPVSSRAKAGSASPFVSRPGTSGHSLPQISQATANVSSQINQSKENLPRHADAGIVRPAGTRNARVADVSTADALAAARNFRNESQKRRLAMEEKDEKGEEVGTPTSSSVKLMTLTSASASSEPTAQPLASASADPRTLTPVSPAAMPKVLKNGGQPAGQSQPASSADLHQHALPPSQSNSKVESAEKDASGKVAGAQSKFSLVHRLEIASGPFISIPELNRSEKSGPPQTSRISDSQQQDQPPMTAQSATSNVPEPAARPAPFQAPATELTGQASPVLQLANSAAKNQALARLDTKAEAKASYGPSPNSTLPSTTFLAPAVKPTEATKASATAIQPSVSEEREHQSKGSLAQGVRGRPGLSSSSSTEAPANQGPGDTAAAVSPRRAAGDSNNDSVNRDRNGRGKHSELSATEEDAQELNLREAGILQTPECEMDDSREGSGDCEEESGSDHVLENMTGVLEMRLHASGGQAVVMEDVSRPGRHGPSDAVLRNGEKKASDGEEEEVVVVASSGLREGSKEVLSGRGNGNKVEELVSKAGATKEEGDSRDSKQPIVEAKGSDKDKDMAVASTRANQGISRSASATALHPTKNLPPGSSGVAGSKTTPSRPEDLLDVFVEQMMLKPSKGEGPLGVQRDGNETRAAGLPLPLPLPPRRKVSAQGRARGGSTEAGGKQSPRAGKRQGALGRVVGRVVSGQLAPGGRNGQEAVQGWGRKAVEAEVEPPEDSEGESSDESSDSGSDSGSEDEDEDDEVRAAMDRAAAMKAEMERAAATAAALARETAALETAKEALRERQLIAARLANEKEAIQRAVAEASEQHAQETAQLQSRLREHLAAVAVEKEAHASTRMEAQVREAQLEAENVAQATALAAAQRALEEAVERVVQGRARVEALEASLEGLEQELQELRRRLGAGTGAAAQSANPGKRGEDEAGLVEEIARLMWRIEQRQQKARDLEEQLEAAQATQRQPSEVERELELRLQQLIDHLIQKQSQVEALASEKATLALRLETVSAALREEKVAAATQAAKRKKASAAALSEWPGQSEEDLEFGLARAHALKSNRKLGLMDTDYGYGGKVNAVLSQLTEFAGDVDSWVLGGASYIRTNSIVRRMVWMYLLLLHFWVLFVWVMHSSVPPLLEPGLP